jgi:hypothetical protein
MMRLITADHYAYFLDAVTEMQRLRYRVFKERFDWDVQFSGDMEIDEFDALPMPQQVGHLGIRHGRGAGRAPKITNIPRTFGSRCQFLADGGGRIADLVDGFLKLFFRHAQLLGPVLDLVVLAHVDLAAITLVMLFGVVLPFSPPEPESPGPS